MEVSEAQDLYERISVRCHFQKLINLHSFPNSFTDNHFYYSPASTIFDINSLLKPMKEVHMKPKHSSDGGSSTVFSARDQSEQAHLIQGSNTMEECEGEEEQVDISSVKFRDALSRLNRCLEEDNLAALSKIQKMKNLSEDQIVVGIGIHLIQKLSGKAETNYKKSSMKCPCGCSGKLDNGGKMFIGSDATWHGELDLFSPGVGITASNDVEGTGRLTATEGSSSDEDNDPTLIDSGGAGDSGTHCASEEDGGGSQGEHTNLEIKLDVTQKTVSGMQQVISQAIVFGWTEYNRHKTLSPYIPSIYIDRHCFFISVYNPVKDSMLLPIHSVKFIEPLGISDPLEKYSGIFLLWVVINHRIFFKKDVAINFDCGFKSQIKAKPYENLKNFHAVVRNKFEVAHINCQSCLNVRSKKRKRSSE